MSEPSTSTPTPAGAAPLVTERVRCYCARCRMRGLIGPVMVITTGFLFLAAEFIPGISFKQLWPVFLIVIGALMLLQHSASTEGHRG